MSPLAARLRPGFLEKHPVFEQVVTATSESFLWRCDDYPWKRNFWNTHPEYEIHLIRNASGVALVGDHIGRFEPGYLAVVGGGLPHDWVTEVAPGEIIRGRDIVLQFDAERLRRIETLAPELAEIEPFLATARRGLVYHGGTSQFCAQILEDMGVANGLERLLLFLRLLLALARSTEFEVLSSEGFSPKVDPETLGIIQKSLTFMFHNSNSNMRLSDLADLAGMGESAFSRFFKKNTGNSFTDHLTQLRIGKACQLLANTTMSVTDVCFAVGYDNVSNFNRNFRNQRGTTPSTYRRLTRQRRS